MASTETKLEGNLFKLNLVRLLFWMHFISAVLVPFYRDWGGLTFSQILMVNAWFMVWNFLLEIPTGTVADVWGRKASLVLGAVVGSGAALIYVSAPSLVRFLVAEIFFATSFTLMSGADEAMLYDTLDELDRTHEAARRYGWLAAAQQVGIVTGALLGSLIAVRLGVRAPLGLQSIPMFLAGLVALTMIEPKRHLETRRPRFRDVLTVGIQSFARSPALKRLAFDMTLLQALAWMIIWTYQPALEAVGWPLVIFGLVHTGMSLGQIAVLSNVERLTKLLGSSARLLRVGAILTGVCYLVLGLSRGPVIVIVAIIVTAAFGLSRPPLFSAHLNHHIASKERATVLSTVAMFRTVGIAIANLTVGLLVDRNLHQAFLILGAATLLAGLLSPVHREDLADP